ncbi:MAG: SDR family NAD(P)-dependent oxidoreductase [bacterium]|nr:SDR family NAD(P)-dependent oxidoreductase [bacterium]
MKKNTNIHLKKIDPANLDLRGLKVAIIGGTGGIGRAISRSLASQGADVMVIGQTFRDADISGIKFIKSDLSLMHEAKRVGSELPAETLDLVIFTTGILASPKRQETAEGIEQDLAISYLNRFVILREIAPRLGKGQSSRKIKPRVFIWGFPGTNQTGNPDDLNAQKSYSAMPVHMNTVAGNEILVLDSAKRYSNATFFGMNPGLIKTNIRSNFFGANSFKFRMIEAIIGIVMPSTQAYVQQILPLLISPDIEEHSGTMFDKKGVAIFPSEGLTESYINKFITASEALITQKWKNTAL